MDYVHSHLPRHVSESHALTEGPQQPALYANMELHPTKIMQDNIAVNGERQQMQQLSVLYGSHLPMRHVIEANILAQVQRPGGYGSSMHGLKMHLGRYEELDFFDIMGEDSMNPVTDKVGAHARAERQFGLSK